MRGADGIQFELQPCEKCNARSDVSQAEAALSAWLEDSLAKGKCAHCGVPMRITDVFLAHQATPWDQTHRWHVVGVMSERSKVLRIGNRDMQIHDACAQSALPHVDWRNVEQALVSRDP